jgi:hypothetical protein
LPTSLQLAGYAYHEHCLTEEINVAKGPSNVSPAQELIHGPGKLDLPGGASIRLFSPAPAGFDALTASARDLKRFGFPPRPLDGPNLARYEYVINRLRGKFNYIVPTMRINADRFHGPRKHLSVSPKSTAGSVTSTNWSGSVVHPPAGKSFSWIQGDWIVPDVGAPAPDRWYYAASWVGIDGDGSSDVCQAGIECEVYRSGSSVTRNIYPWWEWYPQSEVQITNFPVSSGDMVTVLLCANPGSGATAATVFFTNRTTGASTSVGLTAPSGTSLSGDCGEWIVEAPTVGGSQSAIADYGEVYFSACEAHAGPVGESGGSNVEGGAGTAISMVNSSGAVVSSSNLITPTIVQCEYVGTLPTTG